MKRRLWVLAAVLFLSVSAGQAFGQGHQHGGQEQTSQQAGKLTSEQAGDQQHTLPSITLSPDKVQLIGVRTAVAGLKRLDRQIRTVGKVEPDETRLAYVNTKIAGWVKKLFVDFTGKEVKKGQPLLSIYSPDLVTAQEEYLIALRSMRSSQEGVNPTASSPSISC